jgi:hypothetical protein
MHARAAQGTGSSLTSSSGISVAAPRRTSQQAPPLNDRGSLDSTSTQPGPIPLRTKWIPAASLPERSRSDGSCDGAVDNALRASYEAIAQVYLLRGVCSAHMIASPQTRSAAAECGSAAVSNSTLTTRTLTTHAGALFTVPSFDARATSYDAVMKQVSIQQLASQSHASPPLPCPASPTSSAARAAALPPASSSTPVASRRARPASSAPLELESSLKSAAAPRRGRSLMRTYHRCTTLLAVSLLPV